MGFVFVKKEITIFLTFKKKSPFLFLFSQIQFLISFLLSLYNTTLSDK